MLKSRAIIAAAVVVLLPAAMISSAPVTGAAGGEATITRIVATTPDDPEGVNSGTEPEDGWRFWPNPDDDLTPNQMRVDFTVSVDGTFQVTVFKGNYFYGESEPVTLTAGSASSWTWDGRDYSSAPSVRGLYRFQVIKLLNDRGRYEPASPKSNQFELRNGTDQIYREDRDNDRYSGDVDIDNFHLANAPDAITLDLTMQSARALNQVGHLGTGIDVSAVKRGYLFTARREDGDWTTRLSFVLLASDSERYEQIRCPKASVVTADKIITATVPRSCMPYGGKQARIYFNVSSKDYRNYDYGPDAGATGETGYYTDWVRWSVEPPT